MQLINANQLTMASMQCRLVKGLQTACLEEDSYYFQKHSHNGKFDMVGLCSTSLYTDVSDHQAQTHICTWVIPCVLLQCTMSWYVPQGNLTGVIPSVINVQEYRLHTVCNTRANA